MLASVLVAVFAQSPFTFRSDGAVLQVDATARCRLLAAADKTELHDGAHVPIALVSVGGIDQPATTLQSEAGE